jgi:hypothetical protein
MELLNFAHPTSLRRTLAALAGALTLPAAVPVEAASVAPSPLLETAQADAVEQADPVDPGTPREDCLATTICSVQNKVRWGTPAWTPEFCGRIARGVLASSKRNDISPSLLLAVMVNESDMDAQAARVTTRNGKVYAKDSGLMGIRCLVDGRGKCTNGHVRGLSWKMVMDPIVNIELGARELARWRTGGRDRVTVRVRSGGQLVEKKKLVTCRHRNHAFWAHYNHGLLYISKGPARHYPQKVAVLQRALAEALDVDATELAQVSRVTLRDTRIRKLCSQIRQGGGQCASVAALTN